MDQIMIAYKGEEEINFSYRSVMDQIMNKNSEKSRRKLIFIDNASQNILKTKEVEEKV